MFAYALFIYIYNGSSAIMHCFIYIYKKNGSSAIMHSFIYIYMYIYMGGSSVIMHLRIPLLLKCLFSPT